MGLIRNTHRGLYDNPIELVLTFLESDFHSSEDDPVILKDEQNGHVQGKIPLSQPVLFGVLSKELDLSAFKALIPASGLRHLPTNVSVLSLDRSLSGIHQWNLPEGSVDRAKTARLHHLIEISFL